MLAGSRTARKVQSRWVEPEAGGAEGGSADARAARSSGGGRVRGGARAAADGGPMEPELEPAAVEVPAGRVLWCGPARGGAGHAERAGGGEGDENVGRGRAAPSAQR